MMNKYFLEDLDKEQISWPLEGYNDAPRTAEYQLQLYIAEKLWSIEQILLQNQEQG